MRHLLRFIFIAFLVSCFQHDFNDNSPQVVLSVAGVLCGKPPEKMQWLTTLIQESQTDYSRHVDMYAVSLDGSVIFVHQPIIMSCLACVLYDCDGDKISVSSIDHEKLQAEMKPSNRIYDHHEK